MKDAYLENKYFEGNDYMSKEDFETHSCICMNSPSYPNSFDKNKYFVLFIDDFSRKT